MTLQRKSNIQVVGDPYLLLNDVPVLVTRALCPGESDAELVARDAARMRLEDELKQAVREGRLPLKDPLTMGPHKMPLGVAARSAVVMVEDLREYFKDRLIFELLGAPHRDGDVASGDPIPDFAVHINKDEEFRGWW